MPIRLVGESIAASASSGEVLARRSTDAEAPGFVLTACGNRRASRCPPCSEIYRRDAYFLVAAGLTGSDAKGVPTSVASHPVVFATLTAPSLARSIAAWSVASGCSAVDPPREGEQCEHGDRHSVSNATRRRPPDRAGTRPDCYDYEAATIWNAAFGSLWRRTVTYLPRTCSPARLSVRALRSQVRVTCAKVADFQARGVVHVHTVVRLDGPDGPETAPTAWATAQRQRRPSAAPRREYR